MTLLALHHSRILLPVAPLSRAGAEVCTPPVDVLETAGAVVVRVELPGTAPSAVRIVVDAGVLVLEGVKGPTVPREARGTVERVLRVERAAGPFRRMLRLPCAVEPARGRAHLDAGVLTIVLPRPGREP